MVRSVVTLLLLALVIPAVDALLQTKGSNSASTERHKKIPKIIHQLAPANHSFWPHAWDVCQPSWKRNYPDWKYRLWNDDDALKLVRKKYPEHLWWYKAMPMNIQRVDAARAFILHRYGGLYADMDYYCYKRLKIPRTGQAVLVESNAGQEIVQNSLMASPRRHPFWNRTFEAMASYYQQYPEPPSEASLVGQYVLDSTGPNMLKRALKGREDMVAKLDRVRYNPGMLESPNCTVESCYTRHIYSGCWAPGTACAGWKRVLDTEEKLNWQHYTTFLVDMNGDSRPLEMNTSLLGPYLDVWHRAKPDHK